MNNWVVHNSLAIQVGAKGKPEQLAKLISQLGPTWNFAESERDRTHKRTMEQHGDSGVIYSFMTPTAIPILTLKFISRQYLQYFLCPLNILICYLVYFMKKKPAGVDI